jgi:2-dehydro-3-deoxy-D-arabinonate dehydratase
VSDERGAPAVFRLRLPDGSIRLASGHARSGPIGLLDPGLTVAGLLRAGVDGLRDAAREDSAIAIPPDALIVAPVDRQEVWAAGVTYRRSHEARVEEATEPSVYDRVYAAERPELFFKASPSRVQGTGDPIGVRADSPWNVPEPELVLVVTSTLEIAGYVLGNDVSSRSIEGENPLYLPQAKVYRWSCAIGPALVPAGAVALPITLALTIRRGEAVPFSGSTTTGQLKRDPGDLVGYLGRAMDFPNGAMLMTGTGIVPDASFTLLPGDLVEIDGGPLGVLHNPTELVDVRRGSDATVAS